MIIFAVLFFIIAISAMWFWSNKITIDWRSIFSKTLPLDRGMFGVYCMSGHQGSGKTYAVNKYIRKHAKGRKIYSNIELFDLEYTRLTSLEQLYSLADKENIFIFYDEVFSLMSKSKKDREMLEQFLPQMRKVKNIFLTTAQYWLELDITFRRFVRVHVKCQTRPLGRFGGILIETYEDGEQMKWDNLENEYVAPRIAMKISKYEKRFMETYNTYERVKPLSYEKK